MTSLSSERPAAGDAAPRVFVLIPAYNEGTRLAAVLEGLARYFPNVVVVDDGSRDCTYEVACRHPIHVLRHALNRGQGAALQTAIAYALRQGAEYLVTYDADGQHRTADIPALLAPVMSGECDVALGSRFLNNQSNPPRMRKLLLQAARWFTWLTSGLYLTDSHNGLRAFSRRAAEKIRICQDRMAHASEMYDQIRRAGLTWREVPVTITYSSETLNKGQSGGAALGIVFQYLMGKLMR